MDVEELIRAELAAQADRAPEAGAVLAGVAARTRARRRRRVTLAAAGMAAMVAAAVPYLAVRHAAPKAPAPPAAPQRAVLPDDVIIQRCKAGVILRDQHLVRDGGKVLVTYTDAHGYVSWVTGTRAGGTWSLGDCAFTWDGTLVQPPTLLIWDGPVDPTRGSGGNAEIRGQTDPVTGRPVVLGIMYRYWPLADIRRVEVSGGGPRVRAALAGRYWLARVEMREPDATSRAEDPWAGEPRAWAYDKAGKLVRVDPPLPGR